MDPLMTIWVFFIGSILGIMIGMGLSYRTAVTPLQQRIRRLTSQQQYYQQAMKYYPYNPDNFRFIVSPVDGIQFEEDVILFVRFRKENISRTKEQDHIKTLLENGKVRWFEFMTK